MVLGLEIDDGKITYAAFGNNVRDFSDRDVTVFMQGSVSVKESPENAINMIMERLQTCNVTHVGISRNVGDFSVNHTKDIETLRNNFFPEYSAVIDISRKSTKIYTFSDRRINNIYTNGKCAAGSGSFIETMAERLGFSVDRFIKEALKSEDFAHLSGRCAVFCESDIVHLFQKGITKDRIAHGITRAVALNVRGLLAGEDPGKKILFAGEVSKNEAVLRDLRNVFPESEIDVCPYPFDAFATVFSARPTDKEGVRNLLWECFSEKEEMKTEKPLRLKERKNLYRENEKLKNHYGVLGLGIDIGSVSTKAALVSAEEGKTVPVAWYYRKTLGDPVAAVRNVLSEISTFLRIKNITYDKIYAGTTGSGRYLTGDFVGADIIKNEITAQVAGVLAFCPQADTVFEIGGQDSKYISVENGVLADFEMNRVCAAGCGAFLEKQADILGIEIEKFGDMALMGKNPPDFDYNCTVFTESALRTLLGKAPKEDLAAGVCIAAAKNYINKNVDGRKIGEHIVFSGAVAMNKGMQAAFENLTGKEINVSPYPHINGAIGVACIALKECSGKEPKFYGFDKIINQKYSLSSFKCEGCGNLCDVSVFDIKTSPKVTGTKENVSLKEGSSKRFFYNDRCEKYSGRKEKEYQVNLFEKYWEIAEDNMERVPVIYPNDKSFGYPRGMLFNEYYPLFGAFFKALGFKLIIGDATNKTIAERGSVFAGTRPCFPFKTAFGHFDNILGKNPDYIFFPRIISGEKNGRRPAHYCPYIQAGPDLIADTFGLKKYQTSLEGEPKETDRIFSPTIYMDRGSEAVKRVLVRLGTYFGIPVKTVRKAVDIAFDAYWDFKDDLAVTGKNITDLYKGYIYAVVGHPYVLYDDYLNMNIGGILSEMGYMPVPADFIFAKEETDWHIYQRETERKLSLASYLGKHNIKTVVLSYYACGSDAFSNRFFREELGRPCYIMNLDEHTSDAGVRTRAEAFSELKISPERKKKTKTNISEIARIKDRILWLPSTDFSGEILANVFNSFGINARVLEESPDETFGNARKEISEDVCLPCLATMEDMLYRVSRDDFDIDREAFFQAGANGPCRLGMYPQRQKMVLSEYAKKIRKEKGLKEKHNIPVTVIDNNFFRAGLGLDFALLAWNSLFVHDLLYRLLLHGRPYEKEKGKAEEIYEKYCYNIISVMRPCLRQIRREGVAKFRGSEYFADILKRACEEFEEICDRQIKKPVIGLTGEFYMKINPRSNRYIEEYIEKKGFEVWKSPLTEYFAYSNFITLDLLEKKLAEMPKTERLFSLKDKGEKTLRSMVQRKLDLLERYYREVTDPYLEGFTDCDTESLVSMGGEMLDPSVCGEAICCLGKAGDFLNKNVMGIINIAPFGCMPGNIAQMFSAPFRRDYENIPFLCLTYDGRENNYDRIDTFLDSIV